MKGKARTLSSAGFLYCVLAHALQRLDGADMDPWVRHDVSRCHGWLTWALSLRLVVAAQPRQKKPVPLTLMGRLFTIAPLDAAMTARLEQWISFGAHVQTVLLRPPRTFLAWRECIQALQTGIAESPLITKGVGGKNGNMWLCRSLCLFAMAKARILKLEVMQANQASVPFLDAQCLAELSRWFPDSYSWGDLFAGTVDISDAMRSLDYRGRPELMTLWLHLASDVQLKAFISEAGVCKVRGHDISHDEFRQAALEALQVEGIAPTPFRLLQSMSASRASSSGCAPKLKIPNPVTKQSASSPTQHPQPTHSTSNKPIQAAGRRFPEAAGCERSAGTRVKVVSGLRRRGCPGFPRRSAPCIRLSQRVACVLCVLFCASSVLCAPRVLSVLCVLRVTCMW